MTKKTIDAAEAQTDIAADTAAATGNLAATLPAGLVQTSAVTAGAVAEAALEHPKAGGSYVRQADGSLIANPDAAAAEPAPEPKCHFDQPAGEAAA
ncbi:hypothetical protein [Rhodoferax sp.]|uniref:hypothetical protein n=1 Tax=Rhodoferax sp. TaxID=50421 RepID=UPI00374DCC02